MTDVMIPVRRALEIHLGTLASPPAGGIQYENVYFDTPEDKIYLRTKCEFTSPDGRTYGAGASSRYRGLFVVDCVGPAGTGPGALEAVVDNVLYHFRSGQILTYTTHTVTLFVPWRESGIQTETVFFIPVMVPWMFRTDQVSEA